MIKTEHICRLISNIISLARFDGPSMSGAGVLGDKRIGRIVMTGLQAANHDLTLGEYRELAELRHQMSRRERASGQIAQELGINPDMYLLLLAIQGLPEGAQPTITTLMERLCFVTPIVNALIDEAAAKLYVLRPSDMGDGTDWVKLTRTGREILRRFALATREDLENSGPDLAYALQSVIRHRRKRSLRVA